MLTTANVPREGEILCEHCGYGLSGLRDDGQCPECGQPVADSTSSDGRTFPAWETPYERENIKALICTSWAVIVRPKAFFRGLLTRAEPDHSGRFALAQYWVAAYLFSVAAAIHGLLFFLPGGRWDPSSVLFAALAGGTAMTPFVFFAMAAVQWIAGKLTVFESRYHGIRLPPIAVRRAMHYHAATLVPVAALTLTLIGGYRILVMADVLRSLDSVLWYLYVLCAWVITAAAYLFWTYWMAMKGVMYANR